ncbi:golgin subfamily A member 6-like protein [Gracilaria domingensis]|nr:golgin subfamily A member 6-like protein [Gracilaria domingensis]
MTSPEPGAKNDEETLRQLLQDRIAQLESREEDPPKSADEQAAYEAFHVASTAARALVADREISSEEKLRVLQLMYRDCISNVRDLEYDLGMEEKRLSVAELDYSELGEEMRKVEASAEKLKVQSKELSKENKIRLEVSAKKSAEEREKREEICKKFDEAMKEINAKLNQGDGIESEGDDPTQELESQLDKLQTAYEKREIFYEKTLAETSGEEKQHVDRLQKAEIEFDKDQSKLGTERKKLEELRKRTVPATKEADRLLLQRDEIMSTKKKREINLNRQGADLKRLRQSLADLQKAMSKLNKETEELKVKSKETISQVKSCEDELEFWRAKTKSELDKRETLERVCRTLTEERTIMRKDVQGMKEAWRELENEIENLRMEINEPEPL